MSLLNERITRLLRGQRLDSFRRLVDVFNGPVTLPDDLWGLSSVRVGIQQALLTAVACATDRTPSAIVRQEYKGIEEGSAQPAGIFLDVPNHIATAERINHMIGLVPTGLGYHLVEGEPVESIGPDAEYLQQFVRELVAYVPQVLPDATYQPTLLLRLNGALGQLTQDPRQHIGKVLGNMMGLESAAAPFPLWVADPILLDDLAQQAATLQRLRLLMHRRDMTVKLVVEGGVRRLEDVDLVLQSDSCHALLINWGDWADLDQLLQTIALCAQADVSVLLAAPATTTPRQLDLLVDLADGLSGVTLLLSANVGPLTLPTTATLALNQRLQAADAHAA